MSLYHVLRKLEEAEIKVLSRQESLDPGVDDIVTFYGDIHLQISESRRPKYMVYGPDFVESLTSMKSVTTFLKSKVKAAADMSDAEWKAACLLAAENLGLSLGEMWAKDDPFEIHDQAYEAIANGVDPISFIEEHFGEDVAREQGAQAELDDAMAYYEIDDDSDLDPSIFD